MTAQQLLVTIAAFWFGFVTSKAWTMYRAMLGARILCSTGAARAVRLKFTAWVVVSILQALVFALLLFGVYS